MDMRGSNGERDADLRALYPHLDDAHLEEAEENIRLYLELVLRIYERIRVDPEAYARFKSLTASPRPPKIKSTGS
jgi:hypothetical protein